MVPRMMPGPLRVEVIVTLFGPVSILPLVMFKVVTPMLLFRATTLLDETLLSVGVLKVLAL